MWEEPEPGCSGGGATRGAATEGRAARADDLAVLIATIQRRWGTRALQRGTTLHATPALLPTGIDALDDLLGGGYPRAAITELLGAPTSGTTSIALTALAQAQARGEIGAYVQMAGSFGAEYAAACGVDLATLILVRPASPHDALELLQALVTHQIGVLIVNALALLQVTAEALLWQPGCGASPRSCRPHPPRSWSSPASRIPQR